MGAKGPYAGSAVCKECHEKFHTLWSTSWHGKASRPYSSELAEKELIPQKEDIVIGQYRYRYEPGKVVETGPEGTKQYLIEQVIGGKATYNFLTTLPDGRRQALPLGYDGEKKEWFDDASTAGMITNKDSGHADWKDKIKAFYTACPSCHVSQYSPSYEINKATYSATWTEAGVNCESCHGSAEEHVRIARKTPKGQPLPELRIIRTKTMTAEQRNDLCSICHGHIKPLTTTYKPGDRFFDHFDLATLEINAFYPDGRGKGETFTLTQWLMNPCTKSAKIDCMHCHTSSGRYRFREPDKANNACLPCHAERVKNAITHTHHKADSPGNQCISCHMAPTYYARMRQSDHSMLPPTPAATIAFGSPNACNSCHNDKDPLWADSQVRSWHADDYQAPLLQRAGLVEEAKRGDWSNLPEMLKYIKSKNRNQVVAATLIRLMFMNRDESIIPALLAASKDPSPLVRSAAVQALGYRHSPEADAVLKQAANDDYRVVRISAAGGLTTPRFDKIGDNNGKDINKAIDEFLASLMLHPDLWTSYEITGNVYQRLGRFTEAETAYQTALKIDPRAMGTLLSLSNMYKKRGNIDKAEDILRQAVQTEPASAVANLSLGLLKYESKDFGEAEKYLREALKTDPGLDAAAYTLSVIISKHDLAEAISWCKTAMDLSPKNPLYAYALALYQDRAGDQKAAIKVLEGLIAGNSGYGNAYLLLGDIYTKTGKREEARQIYSQALAVEGISAVFRDRIKAKLMR